jgi:putative endonuclease
LRVSKTALYDIGVTGNLEQRVYKHKHSLVEGFTQKYGVHTLVYYEETNDVHTALAREKQLKNWRRKWKIKLSLDSGASPE